MGDTLPRNGEGEDIVCSVAKVTAGVLAHRGSVTNYLDKRFDGDVCSWTPVLSEEGIEEIKALLDSKDYYVGVNNQITFSSSNDISDLVFAEMTE